MFYIRNNVAELDGKDCEFLNINKLTKKKLFNHEVFFNESFNIYQFDGLYVLYSGKAYIDDLIDVNEFIEKNIKIVDIEKNVENFIGYFLIILISPKEIKVISSLYKYFDIFYSKYNGEYIVGSDISFFPKSTYNKSKINKNYAYNFILELDNYGIDSPFLDINNVPLGEMLTIKSGGEINISPINIPKGKSVNFIKEIQKNLQFFNEKKLQTYVNFSGGLDSSLILFAAKDAHLSPIAMHWLPVENGSSELELAQQVANEFDSELILKHQRDVSIARDTFQPASFVSTPYNVSSFSSGLVSGKGSYDIEMKESSIPPCFSVSGHGGDFVFMQNPSRSVSYDSYMDNGLIAMLRTTKKYSLLKGKRFIPLVLKGITNLIFNQKLNNIYSSRVIDYKPSKTKLSMHSLLTGINKKSAKYYHLHGIISGLSGINSFEGVEYRLIHPLFMQNVISGVISEPVYNMFTSEFDRVKIREILFDKSNSEIAWRRTKRSSSSLIFDFFSNNEELLKSYIVDGLVSENLNINKEWLEYEINQNSSVGTTYNVGFLINILRLEIYYRQFIF